MEKSLRNLAAAAMTAGSLAAKTAEAYEPDLGGMREEVCMEGGAAVATSVDGTQKACITLLEDSIAIDVVRSDIGETQTLTIPGLIPGDFVGHVQFDENGYLWAHTYVEGITYKLEDTGGGWSTPTVLSESHASMPAHISPATGNTYVHEDTGRTQDIFQESPVRAAIADDQSVTEANPVELDDGRVVFTKVNGATYELWIHDKALGVSGNRPYLLPSDIGPSVVGIAAGSFNQAASELSVSITYSDGHSEPKIIPNLELTDPDRDRDLDPNETDCAPDDASIHHGAADTPDDGVDQNCEDESPTVVDFEVNGSPVVGRNLGVAAGSEVTLTASPTDDKQVSRFYFEIYEDGSGTPTSTVEAVNGTATIQPAAGNCRVVCVAVDDAGQEFRDDGVVLEARYTLDTDLTKLPEGATELVVYNDAENPVAGDATVSLGEGIDTLEVTIVDGQIVIANETGVNIDMNDFNLSALLPNGASLDGENLTGTVFVLGGAAYRDGQARFNIEVALSEGTLYFTPAGGGAKIALTDGKYNSAGTCLEGECLPQEETDTPVVDTPDAEDTGEKNVDEEEPESKGCSVVGSNPSGVMASVAALALAALRRVRRVGTKKAA